MKKSCEKCATKASPKPLFNFENHPTQWLHARNSFKKRFFSFEPRPFQWTKKRWKTKGERKLLPVTLRVQNKLRKIPLSEMHYLTKFDDVI